MALKRKLKTCAYLCLWVSALIVGCGTDRERVDRAFYEWRSEITYSPADLALFDSLNITRLYVHFFDVQWNKEQAEPYPESIATFNSPFPNNVEIVPTIYVTVELMRRANERFSIKELAEKIIQKIEFMAADAGIGYELLREIQLDCDWTGSTRYSYFDLLREIKRAKPDWVLSSTVRLHQIKYRVETGVPPVDRGMLMVYNVGQVTNPSEENSIFTEREVEKYLGSLDEYPLPLDVALPIFSWGVRFHFDRFAAIIDNIGQKEIALQKRFEQIEENIWRARTHTTLRGEPVYAGDIIRIEQPDEQEVLSTAKQIAGDIDESQLTVALYRFDPKIILRYEFNHLQNIYQTYE